MLDLSSWLIYAIVLASTAALTKFTLSIALQSASTGSKLPPSPPAEPILGHARLIPTKEPYRTYAEWGKLYGERYKTYTRDTNDW